MLQPFASQPPTPQIQQNNTPPTFSMSKDQLRGSASNPNLHVEDKQRPTSAPLVNAQFHQARIEEMKMREKFVSKADKSKYNVRSYMSYH